MLLEFQSNPSNPIQSSPPSKSIPFNLWKIQWESGVCCDATSISDGYILLYKWFFQYLSLKVDLFSILIYSTTVQYVNQCMMIATDSWVGRMQLMPLDGYRSNFNCICWSVLLGTQPSHRNNRCVDKKKEFH